MINNVTGIILAGGKSSRMGRDKSFIPFEGKPLIKVLIDTLSCVFTNLIIVTNKPYLYRKYKIKTQIDIFKDCGPLGGIYAGLITSDTFYNFIAACDMPFINQDLVHYMLEGINSYNVVIPECHGKLQPLCAVYSKSCIKIIERELYRDNLKMTDFLQHVKARVITEEEVEQFDPDGLSFININTKRDYHQCLIRNSFTK